MTKEDGIALCHFYDGNDESPVGCEVGTKEGILWLSEKLFCEGKFKNQKTKSPDRLLYEFLEAHVGSWRPYDWEEVLSLHPLYKKYGKS